MRFDGKPALNFAEVAKESVPWSMICLLAAVGPLGTALMSNDAGITKAILASLKPILAGQSPMILYILTIIVACILTQFMNNTILLVVMTPMLCTISGMVGATDCSDFNFWSDRCSGNSGRQFPRRFGIWQQRMD